MTGSQSEPERRQHPLAAIWRGERVRVLYYIGRGNFMVLDRRDDKRVVHRNQMTFVKGRP